MMPTVPHVTSGLGLRKFQADGFLLTRVYNCLPEDEPLVSKHVEDIIKIKLLVYKRCIMLVFILYLYCNWRPVRGADKLTKFVCRLS